jgi:hypothetical protein
VVLFYTQSGRWAGQFVAGTLREAFAVEWLPKVRDGRAMTHGGVIETGIFWPARCSGLRQVRSGLASGCGCGWRRFAGVVW